MTTIMENKETADKPISPYTGSEKTREMVAEQIRERWGEHEAQAYDPYKNALTFKKWIELGFRVKKGEKALRSVTYAEIKDKQGNVAKRFSRTVSLFYYLQVQKI